MRGKKSRKTWGKRAGELGPSRVNSGKRSRRNREKR